ncbi:AGE family epimerase/isomerase [Terrimonas pollutisoli]|uniref:AGE family epimerase/isomerase n=1 Tax=Terrimonas pollutisoli TaxID=3034147 RepID=UPI0023ECE0DF|nr:AGE family epimerase/isomerase [Terrimonas sp. H1YJ31]
MINNTSASLTQLKEELRQELDNILQFWKDHAIDESFGGFYGRVDNDNRVDTDAPKGLVLNARILWTFSAAFNFTQEKKWLTIADRAFRFLMQYFHDPVYGGFYWSVDKAGAIVESRKQVYGIAFCIYAFAGYYKAAENNDALQHAKNCYHLLEQYSFDFGKGGYLEAFTHDWQPIRDLRLSNKDANEKKTMNTHLHVLEAYTNLYRVWKDPGLEKSIELLLENFIDHIIDHSSGHLQLFFDEDWCNKGDIISYGHDIEAAWLLLESAEVIASKSFVEKIKKISFQLAHAAEEGLDKDGGLWYEIEDGVMVKQKHSWPQAEAMIGFFNAWQISGDKRYLQHVFRSWQFIQRHILDKERGEWFWGVNADYSIMEKQDKIGFWKCPYHNSRACIEIIKRVQSK